MFVGGSWAGMLYGGTVVVPMDVSLPSPFTFNTVCVDSDFAYRVCFPNGSSVEPPIEPVVEKSVVFNTVAFNRAAWNGVVKKAVVKNSVAKKPVVKNSVGFKPVAHNQVEPQPNYGFYRYGCYRYSGYSYGFYGSNPVAITPAACNQVAWQPNEFGAKHTVVSFAGDIVVDPEFAFPINDLALYNPDARLVDEFGAEHCIVTPNSL